MNLLEASTPQLIDEVNRVIAQRDEAVAALRHARAVLEGFHLTIGTVSGANAIRVCDEAILKATA